MRQSAAVHGPRGNKHMTCARAQQGHRAGLVPLETIKTLSMGVQSVSYQISEDWLWIDKRVSLELCKVTFSENIANSSSRQQSETLSICDLTSAA